jgi:hypothetical protein
MSKGQRRSNREIRKPKKAGPPKQNASKPSLKGASTMPPTKKG